MTFVYHDIHVILLVHMRGVCVVYVHHFHSLFCIPPYATYDDAAVVDVVRRENVLTNYVFTMPHIFTFRTVQ